MMGDLLTRVVEPGRGRRPRWNYPAPSEARPATVIAVTAAPRNRWHGTAPEVGHSVMKGSLWLETAPPAPTFAPLDADVTADVCVVGAGIVGVTAALLLQEAGARVVLIDAGRVGHGVTGHTTGKVSSQHGAIYAQLQSKHGARAAELYGAANEAALDWIEARGVDCDFRRRPRTCTASRRGDGARSGRGDGRRPPGFPGRRGAAAVRGRGRGAVRRPGRVPRGEVPARPRAKPCRRCTSTPTRSRSATASARPGGTITAEHTIVATHFPFPDRSLAFARAHPQRSYAIACRIADAPPEAMFLGADSPTRSIRAVPVDGEELLLVGGEGHRPGTGGDTEERYAALERFAREHWDVRSVEYRWSAQDPVTVDSLPLVGPDDAVRGPRADGDRLRQVGPDRRHRGRAPARRPRPRAARTRTPTCSTPPA